MCEAENSGTGHAGTAKATDEKTIPIRDAVGTVLAHDITEIKPGQSKGRAFKKGHVIQEEDIRHFERLGKDRLYVLDIAEDEMHEDEAADVMSKALMGAGVAIKGEPSEGKITFLAARDGLLKVNKDSLMQFNMLGEVMCATLHSNTVVKKGQVIGGTRAIPLVVKRQVVQGAVAAVAQNNDKVLSVKQIKRPKAGVVITGNEVYYGRIKDAFAPVVKRKIEALHGEIIGIYYAPDDQSFIESRLRELVNAGADILITTGGMSVDPDDVTRFAIRGLGAADVTYGSPVLPGAMFMTAHLQEDDKYIPILGIPACGMYSKTTVLDLVLPRVLAGEKIGRKELAELGHGGLCLQCDVCNYPVCPFGK